MFLTDDYELPRSANEGYMKLKDGENRIRILSEPIVGWEDWTKLNKPIRFREDQKPAKPINESKPIKYFWAMIVWNYNEQRIQILQLTQKTIMKAILTLKKNADWGAPFFYDITILREGASKDTEYSVTPASLKPAHPQIIDSFNEQRINLEALFDSGDPFSNTFERYTQGIFNQDDAKIAPNIVPITGKLPIVDKKVTLDEANELNCLLDCCDPTYKESVWNNLQKNGIISLMDLTRDMYERVKKAAIKKSEEYKNQDVPF
jgi:hypothetical protein